MMYWRYFIRFSLTWPSWAILAIIVGYLFTVLWKGFVGLGVCELQFGNGCLWITRSGLGIGEKTILFVPSIIYWPPFSIVDTGVRICLIYALVIGGLVLVIIQLKIIKVFLKSGACRNCGYDLSGCSDRCPECGRLIAVSDARTEAKRTLSSKS